MIREQNVDYVDVFEPEFDFSVQGHRGDVTADKESNSNNPMDSSNVIIDSGVWNWKNIKIRASNVLLNILQNIST